MKKVKLLISALLLSGSTMAQLYPTNGMVGYYKFEQTDNLGKATYGVDLNSASATLVTPVADKNGDANAAAAFAGGATSYLESPVTPSPLFCKGSVSLAAWVYFPSFPTTSSYHTIAGVRYNPNASPYNSYGLIVQRSNQKVIFSYNNTNGVDNALSSTTALNTNTWYHVAATYDSTTHTAKIYVNGALEGTATTGTGGLKYKTGTSTFVVGNVTGNVSGNAFIGRMDELVAYNRALSSAEIEKLYYFCAVKVRFANKGFAGKQALVLNGGQISPTKFKFSKGASYVSHLQTTGDTLKLAQLAGLKKGSIYKYSATSADSCVIKDRITIRPTVPTNGLSAYLSLADYGYGLTLGDSAGNGFHFNNLGAIPAVGVNGVDSSAVSFNAASYLQSNSTAPNNMSMSIAGWVKVTSSENPGQLYATLFNVRFNDAATPYNTFWAGVSPSGKVQFSISNVIKSDTGMTSNTTVTAGTWVHVAAVYDATAGAKLYINGSLDKSIDIVGSLIYHPTYRRLTIGGNGIGNHYFRGAIDEVLVYSRALTANEVSQIYGNTGIVGIKNNVASYKALALYPNPSQRHITVSAIEKGMLNVYSVEGKLMMQSVVNQGENTLDVADLPAGMYVATVVSDGAVQRTQFVKE